MTRWEPQDEAAVIHEIYSLEGSKNSLELRRAIRGLRRGDVLYWLRYMHGSAHLEAFYERIPVSGGD